MTVKDVIGSLEQLRAGEKSSNDPLHVAANLSEINLKRIKHSKPGGTWRDWPENLRAECHKRTRGNHTLQFMVVWNGISQHQR